MKDVALRERRMSNFSGDEFLENRNKRPETAKAKTSARPIEDYHQRDSFNYDVLKQHLRLGPVS